MGAEKGGKGFLERMGMFYKGGGSGSRAVSYYEIRSYFMAHFMRHGCRVTHKTSKLHVHTRTRVCIYTFVCECVCTCKEQKLAVSER